MLRRYRNPTAITFAKRKSDKFKSIHSDPNESRQFTGKNPTYPLCSRSWQACAVDPAHRATRTLSGLLADKGGAAQISTAMRVLAAIIANDVSLLVTFDHAIDDVIQSNPKARANPKALAQLDGYKRPLVSSLSGNLQRLGKSRQDGISPGHHCGHDRNDDRDQQEAQRRLSSATITIVGEIRR